MCAHHSNRRLVATKTKRRQSLLLPAEKDPSRNCVDTNGWDDERRLDFAHALWRNQYYLREHAYGERPEFNREVARGMIATPGGWKYLGGKRLGIERPRASQWSLVEYDAAVAEAERNAETRHLCAATRGGGERGHSVWLRFRTSLNRAAASATATTTDSDSNDRRGEKRGATAASSSDSFKRPRDSNNVEYNDVMTRATLETAAAVLLLEKSEPTNTVAAAATKGE